MQNSTLPPHARQILPTTRRSEVSGDTVSQPVASAGATYARAMGNCAAFGALFSDELITKHQPSERAVLDNLCQAMAINAQAVCELAA